MRRVLVSFSVISRIFVLTVLRYHWHNQWYLTELLFLNHHSRISPWANREPVRVSRLNSPEAGRNYSLNHNEYYKVQSIRWHFPFLQSDWKAEPSRFLFDRVRTLWLMRKDYSNKNFTQFTDNLLAFSPDSLRQRNPYSAGSNTPAPYAQVTENTAGSTHLCIPLQLTVVNLLRPKA